AATNDSEGSSALTRSGPSSVARTAVSAPGPQPTSSTSCPGARRRKAANWAASGSENRPMNRPYASAGTSKDIDASQKESRNGRQAGTRQRVLGGVRLQLRALAYPRPGAVRCEAHKGTTRPLS